MRTREKIHRGSGNVFADIGVAHPERVLARAQVMSRISEIIKERDLTQKEAGELLDLPQSKVSCLALDRDVEIIIKPKTKEEKVATTQVLLATTS
ncbi:MAG: hypothetical protein FD131_4427 [Rhodocyclaceae bacterium]|nr:MAG: hypothetical protein FD131_4427 [Rhodocyclaceae bacterium]